MENITEIRNATRLYLIDNYPQSLDSIPEEVLNFGIPPRIFTAVFGVFCALLLVMSLTGNSLMFYIYSKFTILRTPSNMLVINLSVANCLMHGKSWVLVVNSIDGGPLLGNFGKSISIYFCKGVSDLKARLDYCENLVVKTLIIFLHKQNGLLTEKPV